jgi:hypothetical protein
LKAIRNEGDLDKIAGMLVDDMIVLQLGDIGDRCAHYAMIKINDKAKYHGKTMRIQKFMAKLYVIRVM